MLCIVKHTKSTFVSYRYKYKSKLTIYCCASVNVSPLGGSICCTVGAPSFLSDRFSWQCGNSELSSKYKYKWNKYKIQIQLQVLLAMWKQWTVLLQWILLFMETRTAPIREAINLKAQNGMFWARIECLDVSHNSVIGWFLASILLKIWILNDLRCFVAFWFCREMYGIIPLCASISSLQPDGFSIHIRQWNP